jgi:hypothetical protein
MRIPAVSIRVVGLGIAAALFTSAAVITYQWFKFFGPPDTFDDMDRQLDSIYLPSDFEWVARDVSGMRSRFAAAPAPSIHRSYTAPWNHGGLCDRLKMLAATHGPVRQGRYHTACSFEVTIPSGWTARLVNVSNYQLEFAATAPEDLRPIDSATCASNAEKSLWLRSAMCSVEEGDALVYAVLRGKVGW